MRDEQTRKLEAVPGAEGDLFAEYVKSWQVAVVTLSGEAAGSEYLLEEREVGVGRAPENRIAIDDQAMSKAHAVFEFSDNGYRIRDLGSMNGTLLNGSEIRVAELKHGDRIQMGEHTFQVVLEKRETRPRTYLLPDA
jgi:pSer/pThr/pTyr-binding forkhead associated (FHA) protein